MNICIFLKLFTSDVFCFDLKNHFHTISIQIHQMDITFESTKTEAHQNQTYGNQIHFLALSENL